VICSHGYAGEPARQLHGAGIRELTRLPQSFLSRIATAARVQPTDRWRLELCRRSRMADNRRLGCREREGRLPEKPPEAKAMLFQEVPSDKGAAGGNGS
jgi:hypothetical protein